MDREQFKHAVAEIVATESEARQNIQRAYAVIEAFREDNLDLTGLLTGMLEVYPDMSVIHLNELVNLYFEEGGA